MNSFTVDQIDFMILQLNQLLNQLKNASNKEEIYSKREALCEKYFNDSKFIIETIENILIEEDYQKIILSNEKYLRKCLNNVPTVNIIKKLLTSKFLLPQLCDNWAIRWAAEIGDVKTVKVLLVDPRVDPSAKDNYAFKFSARNGHLVIVKLLLVDPRVNPSAENNCALQWAAEKGILKVVKLLLKDYRVDPSDENNHALQLAKINGHVEVVKVLLEDPRVQKVKRETDINVYSLADFEQCY